MFPLTTGWQKVWFLIEYTSQRWFTIELPPFVVPRVWSKTNTDVWSVNCDNTFLVPFAFVISKGMLSTSWRIFGHTNMNIGLTLVLILAAIIVLPICSNRRGIIYFDFCNLNAVYSWLLLIFSKYLYPYWFQCFTNAWFVQWVY